MTYSILQLDVKALRRLRKIQVLSSSLSASYFTNRNMLPLQTFCFLFSAVCFVIFYFYAMERYHLYGCRDNYERGFPNQCPENRKPSGIDMSCALCIVSFILFLLLSIALPILTVVHKWEEIWSDIVCNSVQHILRKHPDLNDVDINACQKLMLRLEGLKKDYVAKYHKEGKILSHTLLIKVSSAIYSHAYISYIYRKWMSMCLLLIAFAFSLLFPFSILLVYSGTSAVCMAFASFMFYLLPIHSSFVILGCMVSISDEICMWHMGIFILIWIILLVGVLLSVWLEERHGESKLMRDIYRDNLPDYVASGKESDIDICMLLMGHCQKEKENKVDPITINSFLRRIK